ncbi:MAG: zinc ribbon domain-containing protein [Candidatus Bathyarchaeia archaeon]|jgi:hypothetical protein
MALTVRFRVRISRKVESILAASWGGLEGFLKQACSCWLYVEPNRKFIGGKWVENGTRQVMLAGFAKLVLVARSDRRWQWDATDIYHAGKNDWVAAIAGQEAEAEFLSSDAACMETVGKEVEAAPTVQPIAPVSSEAPKTPIRKCAKCGVKLKEDAKFCDGCGAQLPEFPVREFAIVFFDGREKLAEFQDARVNATLVRAERGRKISRQVIFDDRYAVLLRASAKDASSAADLDTLRAVFAEFEAGTKTKYGEVLTDAYELKTLRKMLLEKYPESELWRGDEE